MAIWRLALLLIGLIATAIPVAAQTSRPVGAFENQDIRRGAVAAGPATRASSPVSTGVVPLLDTQRVVLSLAIVLGLIFGLRWIMKRFFPSVAGGRGNAAVHLLSRTALTPRQQVLLVRVGRRVLVVADNGTQLQPLSEIRDQDEVAHLLGQLGSPAHRSEFEAAFGAAEQEFKRASSGLDLDATESDAMAPSLAATHGEIQGLMTKVRELTRQFGR